MTIVRTAKQKEGKSWGELRPYKPIAVIVKVLFRVLDYRRHR